MTASNQIDPSDSSAAQSWSTRYSLSLVLVLCLAAFFRLWNLSQFPPDVEGDGSSVMRSSFDYIMGNNIASHKYWIASQPIMYIIRFVIFKLTGDLSRGTIFLLSAVFGILTVVLAFDFASKKFNLRVGLISAVMYSLSLWHIIYSRYAFSEIVAQPLCVLVAITLMYRFFLSSSSYYLYAISGLFAAYLFVGYHTILTIPLIFLIFVIWTNRWKELLHWNSVFVVCFFVILYLLQCVLFKRVFAQDSMFFFPKTNYELWFVLRKGVGFFDHGFIVFLKNILLNARILFTLFVRGENSPFDHQMFTVVERSASVLQVWFTVLSVAGLIYMVFNNSNPLYKLMLSWFAAQAIMFFILNRPSKRYWLCYSPAYMISAGVFIDFLLKKIEGAISSGAGQKIFKRFIFVAGSVLLIVGSSIVYKEYFVGLQNYNYNLYEIYNANKIYDSLMQSANKSSFVFISKYEYIHDHLWFYSKNSQSLPMHSVSELFDLPKSDIEKILKGVYSKENPGTILVLTPDDADAFIKKFGCELPPPTSSVLSTNGIPSHFVYNIHPQKN